MINISITTQVDSKRARNAVVRARKTVSEVMPALDAASADREQFERESGHQNSSAFSFIRSLNAYTAQEVSENNNPRQEIAVPYNPHASGLYEDDGYAEFARRNKLELEA